MVLLVRRFRYRFDQTQVAPCTHPCEVLSSAEPSSSVLPIRLLRTKPRGVLVRDQDLFLVGVTVAALFGYLAFRRLQSSS